MNSIRPVPRPPVRFLTAVETTGRRFRTFHCDLGLGVRVAEIGVLDCTERETGLDARVARSPVDSSTRWVRNGQVQDASPRSEELVLESMEEGGSSLGHLPEVEGKHIERDPLHRT